MLQPWLDLYKHGFDSMKFFIGFSNGLYYETPTVYKEANITVPSVLEVSDECYPPQSVIPIENPPPFPGYDHRCRAWYQ